MLPILGNMNIAFILAFLCFSMMMDFGHCQCLTTPKSPSPNQPCAFPFVYNGKTNTNCITDNDPEGLFWCSTQVDSNRKHIAGRGFWGWCTTECFSNGNSTRSSEEPQDETASGTYQPTEKEQTCGAYLGSGQIIGGVVTKRGEIPFAALLGYQQTSDRIEYKCGGTLINRRYVITAAHCQHPRVKRLQISQVVLGDWDLEKDPDCRFSNCREAQRFDVGLNDVIVHEDWNPKKVVTDANDIALIRLPRPALTDAQDPDQLVVPACLKWNSGITVPTGRNTVTGWGRTNNDVYDSGDIRVSGAHSSKLKKLVVPVISGSECKSNYSIFQGIDEQKQICAGGLLGQDSCSGDSGGPLFSSLGTDFKQTKYLIGIVSFGTKQCGTGLPGVYTNVEYYMDWIKSHMAP